MNESNYPDNESLLEAYRDTLREQDDRIGYLQGKLAEIGLIATEPDYGSVESMRKQLRNILALTIDPEDWPR